MTPCPCVARQPSSPSAFLYASLLTLEAAITTLQALGPCNPNPTHKRPDPPSPRKQSVDPSAARESQLISSRDLPFRIPGLLIPPPHSCTEPQDPPSYPPYHAQPPDRLESSGCRPSSSRRLDPCPAIAPSSRSPRSVPFVWHPIISPSVSLTCAKLAVASIHNRP